MGKIHELKTWTEYFIDVYEGKKTFELRKDDRGFEVGDTLVLKDYCPVKESYSGFSIQRIVTHILKGGQFGLEEGYVIMSLGKP